MQANIPPFEPPKSAPEEWTIDILKQHLQTALCVELTTIPLYLFAMYSIKKQSGDNSDARKNILDIVKEEMLHLALVGNCLVGVGGQPRLYGNGFTPIYPSEILYEKVPVTLASATPDQIKWFVGIEQPDTQPPAGEPSEDAPATPWVIPEYKSIGDFYRNLKNGLNVLAGGGVKDIFYPTSAKQQWGQGDPDEDYLANIGTITDLATALKKLELVIEEGEGGPLEPTQDSHYGKFKALQQKKLDVYDLVMSPCTSDFENKEPTYPVMLAFDAAYSYLLWTLEAAWSYNGPDTGVTKKLKENVHPLMSRIMSTLANFLVKQTMETVVGKNAAPPFNLHIFQTGTSDTPKEQLRKIVDNAEKAYPNYLGGITNSVKGLSQEVVGL